MIGRDAKKGDSFATGLRDALAEREKERTSADESAAAVTHLGLDVQADEEYADSARRLPRFPRLSRKRAQDGRGAAADEAPEMTEALPDAPAEDVGRETADRETPRRPTDGDFNQRRKGLRGRLERRLEVYLAESAAELDDRGRELLSRAHTLALERERLDAAEASAAQRAQRLAALDGGTRGEALDELLAQVDAREREATRGRADTAALKRRIGELGEDVAIRDRSLDEALAAREDNREALDSVRAELSAARTRVDLLERELEQVQGAFAGVRDELDSRARDLDEERARRELAERRLADVGAGSIPGESADGSQRPDESDRAVDEPDAPSPGHLWFVPTPSGYVLVDGEGPAPPPGTEVEIDDSGARFLVTKVGRSPLPGGNPRCAYLQAVP